MRDTGERDSVTGEVDLFYFNHIFLLFIHSFIGKQTHFVLKKKRNVKAKGRIARNGL